MWLWWFIIFFFNITNTLSHIRTQKMLCLLPNSAIEAITAVGVVVARADRLTAAVTPEACFLVCLRLTLLAAYHGLPHLCCQRSCTCNHARGVDGAHLCDDGLDFFVLRRGVEALLSIRFDELQSRFVHVLSSFHFLASYPVIVGLENNPRIYYSCIDHAVEHAHWPPISFPAATVLCTHLVERVNASFCSIVEVDYFRLPIFNVYCCLCVHCG